MIVITIIQVISTLQTFALIFACMYMRHLLVISLSIVVTSSSSSSIIFLLLRIFLMRATPKERCNERCVCREERRKNLNRTKLEDTTCNGLFFALKWGFYRKLLGYYMRYILYSIWTQAKICVHNSIYARQSYNNINK